MSILPSTSAPRAHYGDGPKANALIVKQKWVKVALNVGIVTGFLLVVSSITAAVLVATATLSFSPWALLGMFIAGVALVILCQKMKKKPPVLLMEETPPQANHHTVQIQRPKIEEKTQKAPVNSEKILVKESKEVEKIPSQNSIETIHETHKKPDIEKIRKDLKDIYSSIGVILKDLNGHMSVIKGKIDETEENDIDEIEKIMKEMNECTKLLNKEKEVREKIEKMMEVAQSGEKELSDLHTNTLALIQEVKDLLQEANKLRGLVPPSS